MFKSFETKRDTYRCKLSTRAIVESEQKLGYNPINILSVIAAGNMPKLGDLLTVLYFSMKDMNHGIKLDDIYGIFDDYTETGKDITDLIAFITDLMQASGLIGAAQEEESEEKAEDTEKN